MAAVRLFVLLLALGGLAHAAPHRAKVSKISDLADTVNKTIILSKFAALLQASDLGTFMSSRGPFTLFVPVNSAFSKLPPGMFEDLLRPENKVQLQRIVLFALVSGKAWDGKDLVTAKTLPSCEGTALPLRTSRSGVEFVAKARVIRTDVRCANGLMHQIDSLLIPPKLLLVAAVAAPDAASTNAAPTDASVPTAPPTNEITDVPPLGTNAAPSASAATNTVPPSPVAITNAPPAATVPAAAPAMR